MKFKSLLLFLLVIFFSFILFSCDNLVDKDTDTENIIKPSKKITISFDSDGGETIENIEQYVDKMYELPVPTKNGYSFDGWYNGESLINTSGIWTIEDNVLLKAKWIATKYSINYITIGGTNNNPSTYTVEDKIIFEALEWKVNEDDTIAYEFAGWYKDASFTEPFEKIEVGTTGNLDVYAKWNSVNIPEKKTETVVTLKAQGFECDNTTSTFVVGESYSLPQLQMEGYIFVGWKTEDDTVILQASGTWTNESQSLSLVPNWTKRVYSITYVLNDGINNKINPTTFTITDTITLKAPTKEGFYFDGWYSDEMYENAIEAIESGTKSDIKVYAKWLSTHTITYDAVKGEIEETQQTLIFGKEYTLYTPTKLGYAFDGWYIEDELVPLTGVWAISSDVTLVGKWIPIQYSVTYDFNGGTAIENGAYPKEYNIESTKALIDVPIAKDGYKFIGWENTDGVVFYERITKGTYGNLSLKAMWYKCIEPTFQDEKGIQYYLKSDNTLSVIGYVGPVRNLFIPCEYEGYTVTEIGEYAFCGYGLRLAATQTSSFYRCDIPQTVTKISKGAFVACDDLKVQLRYDSTITVDEWVKTLIIEERNDHVLDVIQLKRPAIGWYKYWVPSK